MIIKLLKLTDNPFSETETRLLNFVSEERKDKIKAYRFLKDKKLSLFSELLMMKELSSISGKNLMQMKIINRKNLKPVCNDVSWNFNISHTDNAVLIGLSEYSDIGVDIEKDQNPPYEVMPLIFHQDEINYIKKSESQNLKSLNFFKIWTKKEAYSKYTGFGLSENLKSINCLQNIISKNFLTFKMDDYICSLYCTELSDSEPLINFNIYTEDNFVSSLLMSI